MRLSWDKYFIKIAIIASERATCSRLRCGCVLVKDKNIVATGYNGSIPGDEHCDDIGCLVVDNHCIRTVHSEQNAIFQAVKHGVSLNGAIAYITTFPCFNCAKSLIMSGITKIIYKNDYKNNDYVLKLCNQANVQIEKLKDK